MAAAMTPHNDRIVVGYDGSPSSKQVLEWAASHAEETSSTLEVITAWMWPTSYGAPLALPEDFDATANARALLEDATNELKRRHPGLRARFETREGPAASVLVEASEGAALLTIGCRGHGGFVGMLIGSVSEHCVAHAHCPVLVFRSS